MLELRSVTTAMAAYGADGLLRTDDLADIKDKVNEEIRETSGAIRELCGAIIYEQKSLMKDNILLEKRISQLKMQHVALWDAVVEGHKIRVEATNDKIKEVLKHFKQVLEESNDSKKQMKKEYGKSNWQERYYKLIGASKVVTQYFQVFTDRLNKVYPQFKTDKHPESSTGTNSQPITVITPVSNAMIPNLNNAMIMRSVHRDIVSYKALEAEITPLRAANQSLIQQETKVIEENDENISKLKSDFRRAENDDNWSLLSAQLDLEIRSIQDEDSITRERIRDGYTRVKGFVVLKDGIIQQGQIEELKLIRKVVESIIKMQKE